MADNKDTHSNKKSWLKNLLNLNKGHSSVATNDDCQTNNFITDDFWTSMEPTATFDVRIGKLRQFETLLETKRLEKGVVEKVWIKTKDMLNQSTPANIRKSYFQFLNRLIACQYRQLGILRAMFYQALKVSDYTLHDDILNVMLLIDALTDHGKNLNMLEHEIGLHLVKWMDQLGGDETYLCLLLNIIKFNSSHLGRETVQGIVQHLCEHCSTTSSTNELQSLLKVLDAIVCYNSLPQGCLYPVTVTLCRTLNLKDFCDQSWNLMRKLLGTHLGHSCVEIMCQILQSDAPEEFAVLRSAVFFISMGLWGSKCVSSLMHKPQSVLPSFEYSLKTKNPIVGFEIALTCQRLIKKFGHELHVSAWDNVLSIIVVLLDIVDCNPKTEKFAALQQNTHELLTLIEKLYQTQAFNGSVDDLFDITEKYMSSRPTDSILLLVAYRSQSIKPAKANWISNLSCLVDKYYNNEVNVKVRLATLDTLLSIIISNIDIYEKELVDIVVIPKLQNIADEASVVVQEHAVKFLLQICTRSTTNRCTLLLHILKPFSQLDLKVDAASKGSRCSPVECTLRGLSRIFLDKLYTAHATHAVQAFDMLVCFLECYYADDTLLNQPTALCDVRKEIFETIFEIRANTKQQVMLSCSCCITSNVICEPTSANNVPKSPTLKSKSVVLTDVHLSFQGAFSCILHCLDKENHWPILETTLKNLCKILNNKSLILTVGHSEIDNLTEVLTGLVSNANRNSVLTCTPSGFKRADLQSCALSAISVLTSFHEYMDIFRQRQILRCLESGFTTKCAKQCICATTLCMMEMKSDALLRVLPSILLHLSQMSATVHLATVVLELLSCLSQLPSLYSNFVEDQYMSVFAIVLQHANPAKFSLYVVSLAHHVISMWFVKCRLNFRPDFVRYIARNLQNVNRNSATDPLQHSLIESCIDVMARYTFSNGMPVTKRSDLQRSMSKTGQTSTWLLGNQLVTIKTDGQFPGNDNKSVGDACDNMPADAFDRGSVDAANFERKMSVEAPGKLQSTTDDTTKSSRHRHKSSGAVLRRSMGVYGHDDKAATMQNGYSTTDGNGECDRCANVTDIGSSWAEICIRRPSGNTSLMLNVHQLRLMQVQPEVSVENLTSISNLSLSTSDVLTRTHDNRQRPEDEDRDVNNLDELAGEMQPLNMTRHRSHTVSSSQDYAHRAASRAAAKVRHRVSDTNFIQKSDNSQSSAKFKQQSDLSESSLTPGFVFLQLFHSAISASGVQRPLLLPSTATIDRAVHVLDLIPPYDTWQTGVVYVRPGQGDDARAILFNEHGSTRYQNFLSSLGQLIALKGCDMSHTHLGGLDQAEGEDGEFTYVWQENIMQMVFHVATLMPNRESSTSSKLRHIGNDYVTIVYDDNDPQRYVPGTIVKGQFLSAEIIVTPLDLGFNSVNIVYHKPELQDILQISHDRTISDDRLGLLVRQLALHANMAAIAACRHQKTPEQFVSKPLSRLKQIKRIRSRAIQEIACKDESNAARYSSESLYTLEEFSDYV